MVALAVAVVTAVVAAAMAAADVVATVISLRVLMLWDKTGLKTLKQELFYLPKESRCEGRDTAPPNHIKYRYISSRDELD